MNRFVGSLARASSLLALGAAVLLIAPADAPVEAAQPPAAATAAGETHTFVGTLAGGPDSARIGIAVDDKNFLIYVCSQDPAFNADHAAWFKGARAGDTLEATNGNRTLKATLSADKLTGEIASGDKTITFTAKGCDDHVVAGLYRATDTDDGKTCVFGWVVDEDGFVAGGVQRPGVKGTGVLPNNGILGGVTGQANGKANPVFGQRVQNPANPPVGKKGKGFSAARRAEFLARIQAKTPTGGNPLLIGMIHLLKRFDAGARAEGKIEVAAFAQFRRLPKQAITDYLKNWDGLPLAVRQRLAGAELAGVDAKKAVTVERMSALIKRAGIQPAGPPVPRSAVVPTVTQVKVKELRALDTTGEVNDEIFAVYVVGTGNQLFTKTTAVIEKVRNGNIKSFAAADQIVFPPAEQPNLVSAEDVLITATLFEQDGNIALIANLVKVVVDAVIVTIAIVTAPAGALAVGFVAPANLLIDQIAAGLSDAQTLGTDSFRATPDGNLKRIENNTSVSELKFKQASKSGPGPFDFRLTGLDVKTKN